MSFIELNTDQLSAVDNGYNYAGGDTVRVDANVLVSTTAPGYVGAYTSNAGSEILNFGEVFSLSGNAVCFDTGADNGTIYNEAGGKIIGGYAGVYANGTGDVAANFGTISGTNFGILFDANSSGGKIINSGSIYGQDAGVFTNSFNGSVYNSGTIHSDIAGIAIAAADGSTTKITNTVHGVISGGQYSIVTNFGAMLLNNYGTINGEVLCNADAGNNDVIHNFGKIHGIVGLFGGNDVFDGKGGTSGAIFCGEGNDRVIAGNGSVAIHVGSGDNTLTGGNGHDRFVFDSALSGQVDKINNFNPANDHIVLSASDFAGVGPIGHALAAADFHLGSHAQSASEFIVYNANNGFLFYDPHNGGPEIHFATLSPHLALTHANFLVEA